MSSTIYTAMLSHNS